MLCFVENIIKAQYCNLNVCSSGLILKVLVGKCCLKNIDLKKSNYCVKLFKNAACLKLWRQA